MPTFHWTGVTRQGQNVSGQTDASSENEVIQLLRARGIATTKITAKAGAEPADPDRMLARAAGSPAQKTRKAHPFRGLVVALVWFAAAFAVGAFAPVFVYDCERAPGGAVRCTVRESMWGIVPLHEQTLRNVTNVTSETETSSSIDSSGIYRTLDTTFYRLVFEDSNGKSMRPFRWTSKTVFGTSLADVESKIGKLVDGNEAGPLSAWHLSVASVIVAAGFALVGLLIAIASLLSFSKKFTDAVYTRVNGWAESARRPDGT